MLRGAPLDNILNWIDLQTPLTHAALARLRPPDFVGRTLGYAGHIEPKMISHLLALKRLGLNILVSPCVPGVVDRASFDHLAAQGIARMGDRSRTWNELTDAWDEVIAAKPDVLFDIGGGLIRRAVERGTPIRAAAEATSTGVSVVSALAPNFPVVNWNDIPFKTLMHNRYEVGSGVWYAFRNLTGLDVCRMRVGVVGFGQVGQSVAVTARGLGARVAVAEMDPMRQLVASSEGFETASLAELVARVDVIVTATGATATLGADLLRRAKNGVLVANAGHDDRDIDLGGLSGRTSILPGIDRFRAGDRDVYLLGEGRLLNLAAGGGSAVNTFDLMTALMVRVIEFLVTVAPTLAPGLGQLPDRVIEDLIARAAALSS